MDSKHLLVGVIVGAWTLTLGFPSASRAQDPVEKLRLALNNTAKDVAAERTKEIQAAMGQFKTIAQNRRAFFLSEWSRYKDFPNADVKMEIAGYRQQIADNLRNAIVKSADSSETDSLVAVAIMIAQLAETELAPDTKTKETKSAAAVFVRSLTDATVKLTRSSDVVIRQAALNALGKITPDPKVATPIVQANLKSGDLGPQRLAAYALVDLVKNSQHYALDEEVTLLKDVIDSAVMGLKVAGEQQPGEDERTRGYCLEAIQEAAVVMASKFNVRQLDVLGPGARKTPTITKEQAASVFGAFKSANPTLVQALADSKIRVRLVALEALDQISITRSKVVEPLGDHDPLAGIIQGDMQVIARLLTDENQGASKEDRVRLRRGAISFFEQLGDKAAPAEPQIAGALRDEDRFVKLTAMRTISNIRHAAKARAIQALALNLLEDNDADLTAGAADALEAIGPKASEAVPALGIVIRSAGDGDRRWDVENRVKAMKALVSIGNPAAQAALPDLLTALTDSDTRMRRAAAEAIGQIGRPADTELLERLIAALRERLRDVDAEVQLNASEAILILRK